LTKLQFTRGKMFGMKIAIASGKGGTGKTTVSTNLAFVASQQGGRVAYLDCDVEEPNGHIFLKPQLTESRPVGSLIPAVDNQKCTQCGACARICRFNAIACLGTMVLVFPELCHSCGGCSLVCPEGAITEVSRERGRLDMGKSGSIAFSQGLLNIGEVMSPPVIRAVKESMGDVDLEIIDAPPGTSCPVIESVRGCDYVVLVTESTPFGLNDLRLAVDMVRALKLPFGVVINRAGLGNEGVQSYCQQEQIPLLAQIPDDRRVAEAYSRGEIITQVLPDYTGRFEALLDEIKRRVAKNGLQEGAL
jgi:MinD superfamily P-loop ATPase